MKKVLCIFLMVLLLTCTFLQSIAFADLAPDPEPEKFNFFNNDDDDDDDDDNDEDEEASPVIFYAIGVGVVVIASVVILRSMRKKNSR